MVVGESGLGKSTLINSLFLTDLYPGTNLNPFTVKNANFHNKIHVSTDRVVPNAAEKIKKTVQLDASTVEIEERGVKLRLTVVDTPGFGDAIDNIDSFQQIIRYIDEQYERYLKDESGLNRKNIIDNRVHCCFYFVNPYGHGLKPLDIEVIEKTTDFSSYPNELISWLATDACSQMTQLLYFLVIKVIFQGLFPAFPTSFFFSKGYASPLQQSEHCAGDCKS